VLEGSKRSRRLLFRRESKGIERELVLSQLERGKSRSKVKVRVWEAEEEELLALVQIHESKGRVGQV